MPKKYLLIYYDCYRGAHGEENIVLAPNIIYLCVLSVMQETCVAGFVRRKQIPFSVGTFVSFKWRRVARNAHKW